MLDIKSLCPEQRRSTICLISSVLSGGLCSFPKAEYFRTSENIRGHLDPCYIAQVHVPMVACKASQACKRP